MQEKIKCLGALDFTLNKPDLLAVQTRVARVSLGDGSCTVRVHRGCNCRTKRQDLQTAVKCEGSWRKTPAIIS